jgi:predicted enzyme involved in methoxymalonyl-ACP biosynthesis
VFQQIIEALSDSTFQGVNLKVVAVAYSDNIVDVFNKHDDYIISQEFLLFAS